MTTNWRSWYDDSSIYDSSKHKWADLPDDGFQIRMLYYEDGTKQAQMGMDYYYEARHKSGIIYGAGMDKQDILDRYNKPVIKRGRWVTDVFFKDIFESAMASKWQ